MSVKIRLKRMGSKRRPFYRFVVVDSRAKRDGGVLDLVGHYNPIATPHEIRVDEVKVSEWLGKGAQLSDGARSLLKKAGVLNRLKSGGAEAEQPGAGQASVGKPELEEVGTAAVAAEGPAAGEPGTGEPAATEPEGASPATTKPEITGADSNTEPPAEAEPDKEVATGPEE
jgi:small subunit ribosomal protein S16